MLAYVEFRGCPLLVECVRVVQTPTSFARKEKVKSKETEQKEASKKQASNSVML